MREFTISFFFYNQICANLIVILCQGLDFFPVRCIDRKEK